jgi:hypothetical protein
MLAAYYNQALLAKTGLTAKHIKQAGKQLGLKSKARSSAREVLRHTNPAKAAELSLMDYFFREHAYTFDDAHEVSQAALLLFQKVIEKGGERRLTHVKTMEAVANAPAHAGGPLVLMHTPEARGTATIRSSSTWKKASPL